MSSSRFYRRGQHWAVRVPHPAGGSVVRTAGTKDREEARRIATFLRGLHELRMWDVLYAIIEDGKKVSAAYDEHAHRITATAPPPPSERQPVVQTQVYFIRRKDTREIKIGVTRDLAKRLNSLQAAHAVALEVLALVPGGVWLEKELHRRFAEYRLLGEWFRECDAIHRWLRRKTRRGLPRLVDESGPSSPPWGALR